MGEYIPPGKGISDYTYRSYEKLMTDIDALRTKAAALLGQKYDDKVEAFWRETSDPEVQRRNLEYHTITLLGTLKEMVAHVKRDVERKKQVVEEDLLPYQRRLTTIMQDIITALSSYETMLREEEAKAKRVLAPSYPHAVRKEHAIAWKHLCETRMYHLNESLSSHTALWRSIVPKPYSGEAQQPWYRRFF